MDMRRITVEEVWPTIQPGIDNIIDIIEGIVDEIITNEERVLPNLVGKRGDILLQEVVKRWDNHKYMTVWTTKFFVYLNKYFIPGSLLPTLQESSYSIFHRRVLGVHEVMESITRMIHRVRIGDQRINQDLLKSAIDIYVNIGKNYYEDDFEEKILEKTHQFYSLKALKWINDPNISYQDYMLKLDESLMRERHWAGLYVKEDTRKKLLKIVNHELVNVHTIQLEEKRKRRRLN
ncbi:cullin-1-like [Impatiens glandulifera]|uniref:cullin-1-like n=1 Tax=Impatiens glandulifera TaxID=253017 RepID=UPI001FB067F4|nr:cullin-1-like [Impatiens glandulifera]